MKSILDNNLKSLYVASMHGRTSLSLTTNVYEQLDVTDCYYQDKDGDNALLLSIIIGNYFFAKYCIDLLNDQRENA